MEKSHLPISLQFVPQSTLMFVVYDAQKKAYLYYNGYTERPFVDEPKASVDQSMTPEDLADTNRQYDVKIG